MHHGHITKLVLSGNNLMGVLPDSIGHCKNMAWCRLDYNHLTGPVPASIGGSNFEAGCKSLEVLGLMGNRLHGDVPLTLVNCKRLKKLYLANNCLEGLAPMFHRFRAKFGGQLDVVL